MRLISSNEIWSRMTRLSLALVVFAGPAIANAQSTNPPQYTLLDLGQVGAAGQPFHIADNGLISGAVGAANGADHSVIYFQRHRIDISTPGLGGANSMPFGNSSWGQAVGGANTSVVDPNGEDFCGFQALGLPSSNTTCLPFLWQNGAMAALPTLDGNQGKNGVANAINNYGEIGGSAENTSLESTCPAYNPDLLQYQKYQFKPVYWTGGKVHELATLGGDPDGTVLAVNDVGQLAGGTGNCSTFNPQILIGLQPLHAVLWQKDGTAIDLGNLGGNGQGFGGNLALGINNYGQVVGISGLSDNVSFHGFLWTKEAGKMMDLGAAPGIGNSSAIAINDNGVIVGVSSDATHFSATIWKNGVAADLNTLIPPHSPLHLLLACSINSSGQIIGLAVNSRGQLHGYLLSPVGN